MNTLTRAAATALIHAEQDYALAIHSDDQHTPLEWLSFIRSYAERAIDAQAFDSDRAPGDKRVCPMATLRIIGGLAITAIEQHGAPERKFIVVQLGQTPPSS